MTTREWEAGLQIRSDQGLVQLGNAHPQHDGRGSQGHQAQESSGTYNTILSSWMSAATTRGGIFSQSSVFQAFSDVMVIIDGVSTFCRGQFANLGPHLAILLLTNPIEK